MFNRLIHASDGKPASPDVKTRYQKSLTEVGQLRFTAKEVFFPRKLHHEYIRYDEIIWAYIRIECSTSSLGLGYTSISVSYLVLRIADGREFTMGMPTDTKADEALNIIEMYAENARIGHTPENCDYFGVTKQQISEEEMNPGIVEIPLLKKRIKR